MNSALLGLVLLLSVVIVVMWGKQGTDIRLNALGVEIQLLKTVDKELQQTDQNIVKGMNDYISSVNPLPPSTDEEMDSQ